MLQPVGPLPPSVYWRRRVLSIAAAVLALVAVVWVSTALAGSGDTEPVAQAGALPSSTTTAEATTEPTTAPSGSPATSEASTTPGPTPAPTTEPTPVPEVAPEPTQAPAPPACDDTVVGLTAQVAQPQYAVGEQPVFRLVVTNTGPTACTRDLDASLQQALVFSADGATRLWSSNDCFPGDSDEVATLEPGVEKVYSVRWAGTTSEPGCAAPRNPVPAGSYTAVVGLGALTSQPVPFTLV